MMQGQVFKNEPENISYSFHPSEVDKMSTRNFWELSRKL